MGASKMADETAVVRSMVTSLPLMAKFKETHPRLSRLLALEPEGTIRMLKHMGVFQVWMGQTDVVHMDGGRTADPSANDKLKRQLHEAIMTQHADGRLVNASMALANMIIDIWADKTGGQGDPWPAKGTKRTLYFPLSTSLQE